MAVVKYLRAARLPARAAYPLQTVLLTACMAVVMSLALTFIRSGPADGWLEASLRNAVVAWPIALGASFVIAPWIRRLVAWVTRPPEPEPCDG